MYLHKNNIDLCKLDEHDLSLLLNLKDESWFGTHKISIINMYDQKKWFERLTTSNSELVMMAWYGTDKIGIFKINIDWMNRSADIGQDIFAIHRGKGFGYKIVEAGIDFCFEVLNLNRLTAEVLENNTISQKVLFKGGFIKEGIKRDAVFKCNKYLNSIMIGIIRNDWVNLERVKQYGGCCNQIIKDFH